MSDDRCDNCGNEKRLRCALCEPSYKTAWERTVRYFKSNDFLLDYPGGLADAESIVGIMIVFEADMKR